MFFARPLSFDEIGLCRPKTLNTIAHKLLSIEISGPKKAHVLDVGTVPNKNWLRAGALSAGQQDLERIFSTSILC